MNETLHRIWPGGLLAVLGLLYLWIGLVAHGWDRLFGIAGGVLILVAAEAIRRSVTFALGLLLLGSLPLAVATWWSIVTPGLAILSLLMGSLALRRTRASRSEPTLLAATGKSRSIAPDQIGGR
jgi:hypothetical protein